MACRQSNAYIKSALRLNARAEIFRQASQHMISMTRICCRLAPILVLSLTPKLLADNRPVGGPPRIGHGRPPLYINLTPATSAHYSPAQLRHAYGFDQLAATGANQKIAIVDAYGNANIQND